MSSMRFNFMHFMPYVHLPPNHKDYKSVWVNFPNKFYDPDKGYDLYQRYLAEFRESFGYPAGRTFRVGIYELSADRFKCRCLGFSNEFG